MHTGKQRVTYLEGPEARSGPSKSTRAQAKYLSHSASLVLGLLDTTWNQLCLPTTSTVVPPRLAPLPLLLHGLGYFATAVSSKASWLLSWLGETDSHRRLPLSRAVLVATPSDFEGCQACVPGAPWQAENPCFKKLPGLMECLPSSRRPGTPPHTQSLRKDHWGHLLLDLVCLRMHSPVSLQSPQTWNCGAQQGSSQPCMPSALRGNLLELDVLGAHSDFLVLKGKQTVH